MKKTSFALLLTMSLSCIGQDVELINYNDITGSARTLGLAGAQSALGADVGGVSLNPANIAMFRRSDLSISPLFGLRSDLSSYGNAQYRNSHALAYVGNTGFVFSTTDDSKKSGIKGFSFGITFDRVNNFDYSNTYSESTRSYSVSNYLADVTNSMVAEDPNTLNVNSAIPEIENLAHFGWKSQLTNIDTAGNFYGLSEGQKVSQSLDVTTSGFHNSWNFASGVNVNDFLYVGASILINRYDYERQLTITDSDPDSVIQNFDRYTYVNSYKALGTGNGYSIGVIVRPKKHWRIGLGFVSEINYRVVVQQTHELHDVDLMEGGEYDLLKKYTFIENQRTQDIAKAPTFNIGNYIQFSKNGFLTSDFQYRFTKKYSTANSAFNNQLRCSSGFEIRKDIYRYRAGFGVKNSLSNEIQQNLILPFWSLGGGIRGEYFYADVVIRKIGTSRLYSPYSVVSNAETKTAVLSRFYSLSITFGTKF